MLNALSGSTKDSATQPEYRVPANWFLCLASYVLGMIPACLKLGVGHFYFNLFDKALTAF
jgi:hypothetical protein